MPHGLDAVASVTEHDASDDALLAAIAGGDRRAFQTVMARHAASMIALAERVTGNRDDADEIVQQAFLKVWAHAGRWRPDGEAKFSSWLYRVVLNLCIDLRRRAPLVPLEAAGDVADGGPDGLDAAIAAGRRRLVADAMEGVPARQRQALSLYYFGEVSSPRAAEILDVSLAAFESLLVRGKRALRTALARRGIGDSGDVP